MSMRLSKPLSAVLLALSVFGGHALADTAVRPPSGANVTHGPVPAILSAMKIPPERILNSFPVDGQMIGWVIAGPTPVEDPKVVYTTPDGEKAIAGVMLGIGDEGHVVNLSSRHAEKHLKRPSLEKFWPALEQSAWVSDGAQGNAVKNIIYGFFDANCIFCHLSWLAMKPYMDAGLQVRWLPVGMLAESSGPKAAAILRADDPAQHMAKGHRAWEAAGRESAFPVASPSADEKKALDANLLLMKSMGISGTPAFIYKDAQGEVSFAAGAPKLKAIPEIVQMPHIENDSPSLDRFR